MNQILSIIPSSAEQLYSYKDNVAYQIGECCLLGRTLYLNLVKNNIGNNPFKSHYWQAIGRCNEFEFNEDWDSGSYLSATNSGSIDYLTVKTIEGLKRIKVRII